jgi:hypothetical protein
MMLKLAVIYYPGLLLPVCTYQEQLSRRLGGELIETGSSSLAEPGPGVICHKRKVPERRDGTAVMKRCVAGSQYVIDDISNVQKSMKMVMQMVY